MDEILSEVRRIREEIVAEHRHELHTLCEALRRRQTRPGDRPVGTTEARQTEKRTA